ncbi:MAG: hypothetical protein E7539_05560 [Ruminococcaceae bacterium]|nr:hypothetical protein [Oscillospiraceae bacterium]
MSVKRTIVFYSFMLFSFAALVLRIFYIIQNDSDIYAAQTTNSYRLTIDKSRGTIYDRNLVPLVSDEKKYKVAVLPSIESKNYLHSVLTQEEFSIISNNFSSGKPFYFEMDRFIKESTDVKVYLTAKRYSENPLAAHFIGYCSSDLTQGVSGIEKAYNELLASKSSSISLSYPIDAIGRALAGAEVSVFDNRILSRAGIALTLDAEIQKIAQSASSLLSGKGSILIMDVNTGEILAGVSLPEYDRSNIAQSIASNDSSLLNRNLCAYNIGSTYKLIVCAAALSKDISPLFSINCTGSYDLDSTLFNCHKQEGHGYLTMKTALSNSCNPYFIKLGLSVGKERLISMSSLFGLGKPIELCQNIVTSAGNLPSGDSIVNRGDLANISFGQGALMATPVHIAKIISIIANGGFDVKPTIVLGEVDSDKKLTEKQNDSQRVRIISSEVSEKIRDYMIYTVTNGTGRAALPTALGAGGKTASAETGWSVSGEKLVQAWFSGFYPAENPKYAIVVLSEGGNSGASACGPVFKKICDLLYQKGLVN